jgi:hypothetical protein
MEILLPAFVLGCVLAYPKDGNIGEFFKSVPEKRMKILISAFFIFLVGVSMPEIGIENLAVSGGSVSFWNYKLGSLSIGILCLHVVVITFISNLGKMFPLFCYRKEVSLKERLALAIGLCPRGEVGAGVIIVALGLITHVDKSLMIVAMLSLALNLILTGPFIMIIKKLLSNGSSGTAKEFKAPV